MQAHQLHAPQPHRMLKRADQRSHRRAEMPSTCRTMPRLRTKTDATPLLLSFPATSIRRYFTTRMCLMATAEYFPSTLCDTNDKYGPLLHFICQGLTDCCPQSALEDFIFKKILFLPNILLNLLRGFNPCIKRSQCVIFIRGKLR